MKVFAISPDIRSDEVPIVQTRNDPVPPWKNPYCPVICPRLPKKYLPTKKLIQKVLSRLPPKQYRLSSKALLLFAALFCRKNIIPFRPLRRIIFFFAQKPGDVFLPSGYFLSGHKHLYPSQETPFTLLHPVLYKASPD